MHNRKVSKHMRYDIVKAAGYYPINKEKQWFEYPEDTYIGRQRLFELFPLPDEEWIAYIYKDILGNYSVPNNNNKQFVNRMKRIRKYIRKVLATPYSDIVEISQKDGGIYYPFNSEYYRPKIKNYQQFLKDIYKVGETTKWWKTQEIKRKCKYITYSEQYMEYIYASVNLPGYNLHVRHIYTNTDVDLLKRTAKQLRGIVGKDVAMIIIKYTYRSKK